ncbi:MAG: hypothetical protein Q8P67_09610 [archaeon]|nr:hypothetical protein [archaeon]
MKPEVVGNTMARYMKASLSWCCRLDKGQKTKTHTQNKIKADEFIFKKYIFASSQAFAKLKLFNPTFSC